MNIGFYFCYILQGLSAHSQWAWAAAQTPKTPHDVWCHHHHPVVAGNAGSSFLRLMSGKTQRPNVTRGLKVSDAARNAAKNIFQMDLCLIKWGRASMAEISADISQYTNYSECVPELFNSPFKLKQMTDLCQFSFLLLFQIPLSSFGYFNLTSHQILSDTISYSNLTSWFCHDTKWIRTWNLLWNL